METEKDDSENSKEYQEEFNKLAEGGAPTKPEAKPEVKEEALADLKPEEKKKYPDPAAEKKASGEGEPKTEESEQDGDKAPGGDKTGIAKALKDTKAAFTRVSMELADLKKKEKGGASDAEVKKAQNSVSDLRKNLDAQIAKVTEDYPEQKELLDLLATTISDLSGKVSNFEKATEQGTKLAEQRAYFEAEVEPEIKKVHPDFRKVAWSKEYMAWVEKQSPAKQYAAMNSIDPEDICDSLTAYKKFAASGDAEEAKLAEEAKKEGIKKNLSSMRGGGSGSKNAGKATKFEELDPNDRDGAFEFLAAQEDKK